MRYALLFVFAATACFSTLGSEIKLVNAGIVFAGNTAGENNIAKRFPHSFDIVKKNSLNRFLAEKLSKYQNSNFTVSCEDLGSIKDNVASLAFVINFERSYVSKLSGFNKYKLEVFIAAEAMVFDFKNKSILASYPFMISYSEISDIKPNETRVRAITEKIYGKDPFVVDSQNINIFDYFLETISKIDPKRTYTSTIGISKVNILAETENNVRKMGFDDESAKEFIANLFNSYIYKNFKIPVIPYSYEGSEIYYVMADGYMEADKLTNQLLLHAPKSTFKIDVSLRKLLSKIASEHRGIRTYFFGSSYLVSVRDIENSVVFSQKIGKGNSAVYVAGEEHNWPFDAEYMKVLIMLTQSAGDRLKNDPKYSDFNKIIEKCK